MEYYVYSRNVQSGTEQFIGGFKSEQEAVARIASCYMLDAIQQSKGRNYFFYKAE